MAPIRNGDVSFWWNGIDRPGRPVLTESLEADVVIVGAGYTGLWTAYYLAEASPGLRIAVVESRHVGYGASGRNGGWLSYAIAGNRRRMASRCGPESVRALQSAMIATVDEVISRTRLEGIDADVVKGGVLTVARNPAQLARIPSLAEEDRHWGDHVVRTLDGDEVRSLIQIGGALGGHFSPNAARLHPVKLVLGLAAAAERRGVMLFEHSAVVEIRPGLVRTDRTEVRAPVVLRCTEGFTSALPGARRTWLPMNSSMIVTAPLKDRVWDEIGWRTAPVLGDMAHAYMYAQRTVDDRIAIGGRGRPYRYGSRTDTDGQTPMWTIDQLTAVLHSMFPAAREAPIDHAWSGVLAVPRDWCASFSYDPVTGLGSAGGYTGHGVATANLAGRVMRDLVLGHDTELTGMPHTNWRSRKWEPEPIRWAGVQAMYLAYRAADRAEARRASATTSLTATAADVFSQRH